MSLESPNAEKVRAFNACEYLGSSDDPDTPFRFPSHQNSCWRSSPPANIQLLHQASYCLGPKCVDCPVLTTGVAGPEIRAHHSSGGIVLPGLPRRTIVVVIEVVAGLILLSVLFWYARASAIPTPNSYPVVVPLSTNTATVTVTFTVTLRPTQSPPAPTATIGLTATPAVTATVAPTNTATVSPSPDQPVGSLHLRRHIVQQEETLISIAALYQTTTDVLVRVNGLTDQRLITIGQVLVIPEGADGSEPLPRLEFYQVSADTPLASIAQQFSTDVEYIRTINGLGPEEIIPTGRWLYLPVQ